MKTGVQAPHTHTVGGRISSGMGQHTHDLAEVEAALAGLTARVVALEGDVVVIPPPVDPPSPPPPPPPPPTPTPSGQAMPVGDLPGWRQIFNDDFTTPLAEGRFPAAVAARWYAYDLGWPDTSKHGYYDPGIVSWHDGLCDVNIRTTGGLHRVACFGPKFTSGSTAQLYGRYAIRFKADSMHGYKAAWLLWPSSETWPRDGEIDFPEGDFDRVIQAYMHRQAGTSGGDQDGYVTTKTYTDWHTAVTEWKPGSCEFFLDGVSIGHSTNRVPNTPMRWAIQNETTLAGFIPADAVTGHVLIDWVAVWAYAP